MSPTSKHEPLQLPDHIHRPDLQSSMQRNLNAVISTLGWLVWLYLFAPLFSLLAWMFGATRFREYVLAGTQHELRTLAIYASIIGAAGLAFVVWALYNLLRFRGRQRRARVAPVTVAEQARTHGVSEDVVQQMRVARVQTVHHDEHGVITHIDIANAA